MSGGKQSATQYRILSPAGQQREGGGADMQVAALPARRDQIAALAHRAELAIGFKQLVSIRQDAAGVTPWRDHAVTPHIGEHDSPGGAFGPGLMGMMAAGVMETGPPTGPGGFGGGPPGFFGGYGGYGDYWAFRALGAGMNTRQDRPMAARPHVTRGRLIPAAEDLSALTVTGEDATVLAFVLVSHAGRVAYDVLNQQSPATYVYRADGPGGSPRSTGRSTTPGSRRQPSTRRASPPRPGRQRPPGPVRSPRR